MQNCFGLPQSNSSGVSLHHETAVGRPPVSLSCETRPLDSFKYLAIFRYPYPMPSPINNSYPNVTYTLLQVPGSDVTLTHALQGYCLAEYPNGLDDEPTYLPWVEQYVDHFRRIILPKYPSIFLDSPSNKDLPSSEATKDLPSTQVCHQKPALPLILPLISYYAHRRTCHPHAAHAHAAPRKFQTK